MGIFETKNKKTFKLLFLSLLIISIAIVLGLSFFSNAQTTKTVLFENQTFVFGHDVNFDGNVTMNAILSGGSPVKIAGGAKLMTGDLNIIAGNLHIDGDIVHDEGDINFSGGDFSINDSDFFIDNDTGNVGIGTISPATALEVNGIITATNFVTAGYVHAGKIADPSGKLKIQPDATGDITLFEDTQVGDAEASPYFYLHRKAAEGNDWIRLFISNSRRGYIHGSPANGLYMQGQTEIGLNSVTEDVVLQVGDAAGAKKVYVRDSGANDVATIDSDGISWFDGEMEVGDRFTVRGAESVGGYNATIEIENTAAGGDRWFLRAGATGTPTPAGGFSIADTTAYRFVIDASGNVGIGTGTGVLQLPLEVRSADDLQAIFVDSTAQAQGVGGGIAFGGKYNDAGGEAMAGRIGTQKTNGISGDVGFDMVFQTQDSGGSITDRMLLTSDGLVAIGEIIPGEALDVDGAARIRGEFYVDTDVEVTGMIGAGKTSPTFRIDSYINRTTGIVRSARFQVDGDHTSARGLYVIAGEDNESGTNYWFEAYDGDGGTNTGGLRSVAGVFDVYNASDKRLKQEIEDTNIIGKDIIGNLKVRDFEWKNNPGRKVTGFIAQEVMEVYPDAVGEPDPETGMYGMSKTALIPPLVKYVQELEARIEKLENGVCG